MAETRWCGVDAAALRARPDEAAEQVTQALRGEPLVVEERTEGWARVVTAYGYPGWIEATSSPAEKSSGSLTPGALLSSFAGEVSVDRGTS